MVAAMKVGLKEEGMAILSDVVAHRPENIRSAILIMENLDLLLNYTA